ncbi:MAG: right-handed parallel beta-helix repeat-containing protein, partial [Eubacterium sp.]|nr:right-handed parallel beta-helix repeat-containing protein [Eubacterium sp.]
PVEIVNDTGTVIKKNTITVTRPVNRESSSGIAVYGGTLSSASAKSYGLIAGSYFVSNIVISKNTVKVKSAGSSGMWLKYVRNSKITDNVFSSSVQSSGGKNGITLVSSADNLFKGNTVTKFDNSMAFRTASVNNEIKGNTFKKAQRYGLAVDSTSDFTAPYSNTFSKIGKAKVLVRKKEFKPYPVTVKNFKASDKTLSWKRIKKGTGTGYKIFRSTKKSSGYTVIATLKGFKKNRYSDETAEKGKRYYYKVAVYRQYKNTLIYGNNSEYVKIKY